MNRKERKVQRRARQQQRQPWNRRLDEKLRQESIKFFGADSEYEFVEGRPFGEDYELEIQTQEIRRTDYPATEVILNPFDNDRRHFKEGL